MNISKQMEGKLMRPLKIAILGAGLVFPALQITRASEKAFGKAVNTIEQGLAENIKDKLKNFGPEPTPDVSVPKPDDSAPTEGSDFNNDTKSDILPTVPPTAAAAKPPAPPVPPPPEQNTPPGGPTDVPQNGSPTSPDDGKSNPNETSKQDNQTPNTPEEDEEERQLAEQEAQLPEQKGAITQTINSFVNRGAIKKIEKQIKTLENKVKITELAIKHQEKRMKPFVKEKDRLDRRIRFLRSAVIGLGILCVVLFITIVGWPLVPEVGYAIGPIRSVIKRLKLLLPPLATQINKIKENISSLRKQIKKLQNQIQGLTMEIYKLQNESLIGGMMSRAAANRTSRV